MSKIKIAIVDDHEVVINGLKAMFSGSPAITVDFTATTGQALLTYLKEATPDVILLDIQMPAIDGIDLCKMIIKAYPATKIIAFSSFDDTHYIRKIMRNGARGYILKNADFATLLAGITAVSRGEEFIDDSIQKILVQESITGQRRSIYETPLTKREKEILKLIAEERSNQEIAEKLFISLRTVESHRLSLNQKLCAKNAVTLVKEAIKRGLIEG